MAKEDLKQEAIQLRLVDRLSLKDIAVRLSVAKSSVSLWVREYPLASGEVALRRRRPRGRWYPSTKILNRTCVKCN